VKPLLDKITPKLIRDKIGQAIDEVGSYIQTGGQYLISEKQIYRKRRIIEKLKQIAS
jgi:hypothetical protein